jgi:nucleoside-diphosphate-sugar epimerase
MRILVTGATSLLGRTTAQKLIESGHAVTVLQRHPSGLGCTEVLADIRDTDAVRRALAGCDAVVHLAAKVGITGPAREYAEINVTGTATLLEASRRAGVSKFVHVSSPSVAHSGHPLVGAPAGPADPSTARSAYSRTKAQAELLALDADSTDLAVVVIRPHLVWGPGDTQLVGRIVARARAGRLVLIDDGCALIDTTYIDNAADSLVAALTHGPGGRVFVVSNGQPRMVADLLAGIARAAGAPPPHRRVPFPVAWSAGAVVSGAWSLLRRPGDPPMTTFLAEQLGTAHWFDQREVRTALQWQPRVGIDEGLEQLAAWYANHPMA